MIPETREPAAGNVAADLACAHGAGLLAAALLVRLRAEGRAEVADRVAAALGAAGIIDPTPPDPHAGPR